MSHQSSGQRHHSQEHAALLREAQKSAAEDRTGRVRCLSCGSTFRTHSALAEHLRKHGGVNAADFTPSRVVGTSHGVYRGRPVDRPSNLQFEELLTTARQRKPQKQSKAARPRGKAPTTATSERIACPDLPREGRKAKTTPLKRKILVGQVLSLTETLRSLQHELATLRCSSRPDDAEHKTQLRWIQGAVKRTAANLQTALRTMNQRFSFRQLVMVEYLANQMEVAMPEENDDNGVILHADHAIMGDLELELYREVDQLAKRIEARWAALELSRIFTARRDPESGKLFIPKPDFEPSMEAPPNQIVPQNNAEANQQNTDGSSREDADWTVSPIGADVSEEQSSCEETEMWGFTDVLSQWAKKAETLTKQRPTDLLVFEEMTEESEQTDGELPSEVPDLGQNDIRVIRSGRAMQDDATVQGAVAAEGCSLGEWGGFSELGCEASQCIFIRPQLYRPDETVSDPQPTEKSSKKKGSDVKGGPPAATANNPPPSGFSGSVLDAAVLRLLTQLCQLQHVHMKSNKAEGGKRWIVSGFSEVGRHLRRGSVKLIIMAQKLDPTIQSQTDLMRADAQQHGVPVITALSRRKMGQLYQYRKRIGVIGVLDYDEHRPIFDEILYLSGLAGHS